MSLEELYQQIYNNIKKINFDSIWKGFAPTKFALYNESACFFDGKYIEKTSDFVANTAIFYDGEYIAIWNVMGTPNVTALTSKIIHEMFHAFQYANHWDICVNELKALIHYKYDEENLSIKLRENKLLLDLYKSYDAEKAETFARYRKCRQEKFPYEFQYESSIHNDKMLLQRVPGDDGYAFIGGHVAFGETTAETLVREFKEEIRADIKVERLLMVGENFFPWGNRPCHQINLYYLVSLIDETQIPLDGSFKAVDELGNERIDLDMCWIPLKDIPNITVYPTEAKEHIINIPNEIVYFVHKE